MWDGLRLKQMNYTKINLLHISEYRNDRESKTSLSNSSGFHAWKSGSCQQK